MPPERTCCADSVARRRRPPPTAAPPSSRPTRPSAPSWSAGWPTSAPDAEGLRGELRAVAGAVRGAQVQPHGGVAVALERTREKPPPLGPQADLHAGALVCPRQLVRAAQL